jgi:transcriptional regulator with XRE-family HTH domain
MQLNDMNITMMGNRLKDIIERDKISAYRISKDLNLDKGHLSKFLNGKAQYSVAKLTVIADYLGYDIEFVKRTPSKKGR